MSFPKTLVSFTCFFIITLALAQKCPAQNLPQDYVNAHNAARAAVGVANLQWNATLATYAQQYADQRKADCTLKHSSGPYAENIAAGNDAFMTGSAAVQLWVNEKANYDYYSNTCTAGKVCGHYTQVVLRKSACIGCARVQCTNGWYFATCNYDPPGNYVVQKPY